MAGLKGATSIVDKWLAEDELYGAAQKDQSFAPSDTANITKERKGLGFQASKQSLTANRASNENTLLQKLEKSNKKRKLADADVDDRPIIQHGVYDDFEEESKILVTAQFSPSKLKQPNTKPAPIVANQNPAQSTSSSQSPAVAQYGTNVDKAATKQHTETEITTTTVDNDVQTDKSKKKKRKTRSKQKNIRRDNRPEHARPQHLQIGSKEYAGRRLTENTKIAIAV